MVQTFETIIIFTDELSKLKYNNAVQKYKNILKDLQAFDIKTEKMGLRKLAYNVKGHESGYYVQFTFRLDLDISPSAIGDLERRYRIDDDVLKFMTIILGEEDENYTPDKDQVEQEEIKKPIIDIFNLIFGIEEG